jgi:Ca2+-binding RTX toxin-like protein
MASFPTNGNDQINGSNGQDTIRALDGNDRVDGRGGRDNLFGQRGNDTLEGGRGDDTLLGGVGDDQLRGQENDDRLIGGTGDDTLSGGTGDDVLTGGRGTDQFNFNVNNTSAAGQDTITDFDERTEFINLGDFGSFNDLDTNGDGKLNNQDDFVTKSGDTTIIDVGAAFGFAPGFEVLTVTNSSNSALDSNDFLFLS